jgi:hypothetical protein
MYDKKSKLCSTISSVATPSSLFEADSTAQKLDKSLVSHVPEFM